MPTNLDLVREFHARFNLPIGKEPALPASDQRALRKRLLTEEVAEYLAGESADDITNIAHELADILYVAYGTAIAYGIPLDEVFAEIHRANMSKTPPENGGKVVKGPGFTPADVASVLRRQI